MNEAEIEKVHPGGESPPVELATLQEQIEEARGVYDWEEVERLYTLALAMPDIPPETEYALRDGRAESYDYLANLEAEQADLEIMLRLTEAQEDMPGRIKATLQLAEHRLVLLTPRGRELAETALTLAREASERQLEVDAHLALANIATFTSDYSELEHHSEQALRQARELGYLFGEARAYIYIGSFYRYGSEQKEKAGATIQVALEAFRRLGDRLWELRALLMLGMTHSDIGQGRSYYEQALEVAEGIPDRSRGRCRRSQEGRRQGEAQPSYQPDCRGSVVRRFLGQPHRPDFP
jgi:tetratricopeptide (TPR) repeat protein